MKGTVLLLVVVVLAACGGAPPAAAPTPRAFTITEPSDGTTVNRSAITVTGQAPAGARIVRDISLAPDDEVTADGSGNWAMSVQLRDGENRLVFRVGDDRASERRLGVTLASAAGGPPSTPGGPTPTPRGYVTQADFGDAWPLTVPAGTLMCENSAVLFQAEGGRLYTVNGMAITRHPELHEIDEIWADNPDPNIPKKNIGPLIDAGLALCQ